MSASREATKCKIGVQTGRYGHFASVTVSSASATAVDERVVVSPDAFAWMRRAYGGSAVLPRDDWWVTRACVAGATAALADLGEPEAQMVLEEIYVNLVDASVAGFALAAYEATHEHLTGARRFGRVDREVLSEMALRVGVTEAD